ncbi:MAG: ATP-binding protein [Thermomonas sp.]
MQPLLLASGIAIGGGLLGAAVSMILFQRRLAREAQRLSSLLGSDSARATTISGLDHLLVAIARQAEAGQDRFDESEAQRRQMSADMVQLMNQSDGAIRAKERFLAAANHDLRQPLQAMDLALEQLRREAPAARDGVVAQLGTGMRTMTEVLDGLLLLSQLDAGTLRAHAATCELQSLFTELRDANAEHAQQAGVELCFQAGAHAVFTDPGMLGGLLGRLLENAINAAPRGGRVLLAARLRADRIRIEVRDNGIGIAPIHQPRVFDEFFQVGNSERDHRKGFGLGLSIVSRLAGLLGTRVELRSALHGGSCFWLELPRASAMQRPPSVLLLDRDAGKRNELEEMLTSWGYGVHAESDVEGALSRLDDVGSKIEAVLCAIDRHDDPFWKLLHLARTKHGQAARIVLYATPSPELLEATDRLGAQALLRPPAPSKLRALLAKRPAFMQRDAP